MVSFTILAGGYSTFIATYLFNTDSNSLSLVSKSDTGENPSWIASHPTNKTILYAVNEIEEGAMQSFRVDTEGSLTAVDKIQTGGNGPAFLAPLSTGQVGVMNFGGGNGLVVPTLEDPLEFDQSASEITFPPPNGGVSHPHMVLEHNGEILVPDLGGDKIWRLVEDGSPGDWKITGAIGQKNGSGPRHIAIHDNELFTLHELDNTLTVQTIPNDPNGASTVIASVNITPDDHPDGAKFGAAEIHIPPPSKDFPTPFIYVSNRNIGKDVDGRGDTIAIFERNKDGSGEPLSLVAQVFTGLDQIRGMEFGPPGSGAEGFLVASGVVGTGGVVVFERTDGGRGLKEVARNKDVDTRTTFVWL